MGWLVLRRAIRAASRRRPSDNTSARLATALEITMKNALIKSAALALALALNAAVSQPALAQSLAGDSLATANGPLIIHPVNHASFVMSWNGKVIYVDPVGGADLYKGLPRPNLILITDIHGDHLHAPTLEGLMGPGTRIVAPAAVRDLLPPGLQTAVSLLANGDKAVVDGVSLEAIPMYNLTEERLRYHTKGRGDGYVLTLGGKRIYIAGDTEPTPEMLALKAIDVAFVPMNLPFTMTPEQAATAVRTFKPKVVYPYHYRGSDVDAFARLVGTDAGVEVRLRPWY
jgi:L-ascorbate metabolism protein UlaG (beta-lactamase superfamily)